MTVPWHDKLGVLLQHAEGHWVWVRSSGDVWQACEYVWLTLVSGGKQGHVLEQECLERVWEGPHTDPAPSHSWGRSGPQGGGQVLREGERVFEKWKLDGTSAGSR